MYKKFFFVLSCILLTHSLYAIDYQTKEILGKEGEKLSTATQVTADINGDGVSDILIAANSSKSNQKTGYITALSGANRKVLYTSFGSITAPNPGWEWIEIILPGDLNNDAVDDFIAVYQNRFEFPKSYLHATSGLDGSSLYSITGNTNDEPFASGDFYTKCDKQASKSVCVFGDVNRDGAKDLLVKINQRSSRLYSGSNGTFLYEIPVADLYFPGDMNGDGIDDIFSYLPEVQNFDGFSNELTINEMKLYSGSNGRELFSSNISDLNITYYDDFSSSYTAFNILYEEDLNNDGIKDFLVLNHFHSSSLIAISGSNGSRIFRKDPPDIYSNRFNNFLSYINDVNNDGIADILTTSEFNLFVFSGNSGNEIYTLGEDVGSFGNIHIIEDRNNDNLQDFLVSSPFSNPARLDILSSKDGSFINSFSGEQLNGELVKFKDLNSDLNSDGINDFFFLATHLTEIENEEEITAVSGANGNLLYTVKNPDYSLNSRDSFKGITNLGDINNDGVDDFSAAAAFVNNPNSDIIEPGLLRVFSGNDGTILLDLFGSSNYEQFGFFNRGHNSLSKDLNQDGNTDIIVPSPSFFEDGFENKGKAVFLYLNCNKTTCNTEFEANFCQNDPSRTELPCEGACSSFNFASEKSFLRKMFKKQNAFVKKLAKIAKSVSGSKKINKNKKNAKKRLTTLNSLTEALPEIIWECSNVSCTAISLEENLAELKKGSKIMRNVAKSLNKITKKATRDKTKLKASKKQLKKANKSYKNALISLNLTPSFTSSCF